MIQLNFFFANNFIPKQICTFSLQQLCKGSQKKERNTGLDIIILLMNPLTGMSSDFVLYLEDYND